jgi:hypothetical protein
MPQSDSSHEFVPEKLANMSLRWLTVEERLCLYNILDGWRDIMRDGLNYFDTNEGLAVPDRLQQIEEGKIVISAINKVLGRE